MKIDYAKLIEKANARKDTLQRIERLFDAREQERLWEALQHLDDVQDFMESVVHIQKLVGEDPEIKGILPQPVKDLLTYSNEYKSYVDDLYRMLNAVAKMPE